MKLRDLFKPLTGSDNDKLAQLAGSRNVSGISDAELVRRLAKGAIAATEETATAPVSTIDTATKPKNGIDKLNAVASDKAKEYMGISLMLSLLLQIDLRPETGKNSLSEYMGFDKNFITKYLQAVLGNFGNPELNSADGVLKLLKSKSFKMALYYDTMKLDDQSSESLIREESEKFEANMARLRRIKNFSGDMAVIKKLMEKIELEERKKVGAANKHLQFAEIMELAEEMPEFKQPLKKKDLTELTAEIDKIIAENAGRAHTVIASATTGSPAPKPQLSTAPVLDLRKFESEASVELSRAIERLGRLYEHCRSLGDDERFTLCSAINETEAARGNMLGIPFNNATEPNVLQLLVNHFRITSNTDLEAKIMEIDAEFQTKGIFNTQSQKAPTSSTSNEAKTIVLTYGDMVTKALDNPKLFGALTELQKLFAQTKIGDADKRTALKDKINSTQVAHDNGFAEAFCTGNASDIAELISKHFSIKNDPELEAMILQICDQFTAAGILTN